MLNKQDITQSFSVLCNLQHNQFNLCACGVTSASAISKGPLVVFMRRLWRKAFRIQAHVRELSLVLVAGWLLQDLVLQFVQILLVGQSFDLRPQTVCRSVQGADLVLSPPAVTARR